MGLFPIEWENFVEESTLEKKRRTDIDHYPYSESSNSWVKFEFRQQQKKTRGIYSMMILIEPWMNVAKKKKKISTKFKNIMMITVKSVIIIIHWSWKFFFSLFAAVKLWNRYLYTLIIIIIIYKFESKSDDDDDEEAIYI